MSYHSREEEFYCPRCRTTIPREDVGLELPEAVWIHTVQVSAMVLEGVPGPLLPPSSVPVTHRVQHSPRG